MSALLTVLLLLGAVALVVVPLCWWACRWRDAGDGRRCVHCGSRLGSIEAGECVECYEKREEEI